MGATSYASQPKLTIKSISLPPNKETPIIDIPDELLSFLFLERDEPVEKKEKKAKKEKPEAVTVSNEIYYIDDHDLESL